MAILIGMNDERPSVNTTVTKVTMIMVGSMEKLQSYCKDCLENRKKYEARLKEIEKNGKKISFWDFILPYGDEEIQLKKFGKDLPELNEMREKLRMFNFDKVILVEGEIIL